MRIDQPTLHHIPDARTLRIHCRDNLRSQHFCVFRSIEARFPWIRYVLGVNIKLNSFLNFLLPDATQ
jgi:hypothetical protein